VNSSRKKREEHNEVIDNQKSPVVEGGALNNDSLTQGSIEASGGHKNYSVVTGEGAPEEGLPNGW
jgi:hypothetical protein